MNLSHCLFKTTFAQTLEAYNIIPIINKHPVVTTKNKLNFMENFGSIYFRLWLAFFSSFET